MESNHSDKDRVTPDDSQETAASELDNKDKQAPEPAAKEGEMDFDVRPADTYLGPDYDPKKSGGPKALWLGILMVAAIIGLTYYAFRGQPVPDPGYDITTGPTVTPDAAPGKLPSSLPEKAPDAADFSPTPETEAAADVPASLPATASSSTPPSPASEPAATTASTTPQTTGSAKAGSAKNTAPSQKAKDESKSTATKPTATAGKTAETKPAATGTKPAAETSQPAATVTAPKSNETKPEDTATAETKATAEPKADETKPAASKSNEVEAGTPAGTTPEAEAKPTPVENAPAAASEISELWVVNISSTPDAAESNRLLNRVIATDVGGQVYFYETSIDGRVHHRIRVGFFNSRGEAEAVGQKVKETFKLSATPWAVKPTVEEVERYQKK